MFKEGGSVTYIDLLKLLLSDDVYNVFKQYEEEIFGLIPELKQCKGFVQNNKWHIYDVYEHILHVILGVETNAYLRLAALFHDIGKPLVYNEDENGIGHFYNHWNKSIDIFKKYQDKFNLSKEENDLIINLIFYHDINVEKMDNEKLKEMISLIGTKNIKYLFKLKRADLLAQSPEFHCLLINIDNQEQKVKSLKYSKD